MDGSWTRSPGQTRHVGVRGDKIVAISDRPLAGSATMIDATSQVVAPGFIDPHWHGAIGTGASTTAI